MIFDFLKQKKKTNEVSHVDKQRETQLGPISPTVSFGEVFSPMSNTPLQGDYAKAVFLWVVGTNSPINQQYSSYFESECGIKDPQAFHKELIKQGYLQEDSPELNLHYLKATDLKEIAQKHGIKSSGKKVELINRIVEAVPLSVLRKYCPATYSLSPMGEMFLLDHYAYVEIHRHRTWELSWRMYDMEHKDSEPYQETFYRMLVSKAKGDKDLYGRNVFYNLFEMMAEGGLRKRALQMLLQVLYIDLSGATSSAWSLYNEGLYTKHDLRSSFDSVIMIAPGIVNRIHEYSDAFSEDDIDLVSSWRLPRNICSKNTFKNIVHGVVEKNFSVGEIKEIMIIEFENYVRRMR